METIKELCKKKGILTAAHRGISGGNIPPNTIAAFDIALKEGADIIEMDLLKSVDGEIFVFHTGMEPAYLNRKIGLEECTAEKIRKVRYCNGDLTETFLGVNTFDEVLEHLKGKCKLNLDKSVYILEDIMKLVRKHEMEDQILMKSDPTVDCFKRVEAYAPGIEYMPVFMEEDKASGILEQMNINYVGAELVFKGEDSPIAQDAYIRQQKEKGRFLWANAILYASAVPLTAGHSDDVSMLGAPDDGWGWLAEKGFDILQTDWVMHCNKYLKEKNYRK